MSWADIFLIAIIAVAVVFAIVRIRRGRGRCSACNGNCSACKQSCCKSDKNNGDKV